MAGASYKPLPKFDERTIATSEKTFHLLRRMSTANNRKAKLQCDELNRGPPKKPDTLKLFENVLVFDCFTSYQSQTPLL